MERVRKISETYPIFKKVQDLTNGQIKAEYSFIGLAIVIFFSLFSRCLSGAITNIFSFILIVGPATNLIVSKTSPEIGNLKHILSYLITFAFFTVTESILRFIPSRIPFYYHAKFLFFYYLSVRRTQLTDYLNASLYVPANEAIRKLNQMDPKATIKAAQSAASEKIKDLSETVKKNTGSPSKEE
ncbi:hypothetical protein NEMIN01_2009 [Nematocida minor]|uniref:uncharacterized protein n=1 Tax=Nematocida minor TaxID=1912983 RepID=UPI00222129AB|nr:uncharacterized protein NEMIN01_2009 [Nematocida minor]KAI5192422.1 hypothetical protein NEMIN01_2009 [Nematocida minor]